MKHLFLSFFSKLDMSSLSCAICTRAKQHRVSFSSQPCKPTHSFTLVHSDVWGPSKITTSSRKRWFVTFIDVRTRLTWVFLVSKKSEVTSAFRDFYHTVETQLKVKIAILQSDKTHCPPRFLCLQQNGAAERKSCHLLEVARSLMLSTSLPFYL